MATHSSILAWRIPGMGEPVGCHLWGRTEPDMTESVDHFIGSTIGLDLSLSLNQGMCLKQKL